MANTNRVLFYRMAQLHMQQYAADAAERLDRELEAHPGESYESIVQRLLQESVDGAQIFGDGLGRRIVLLLAAETVLAFVPEVAARLEGCEAMMDAPEGRQ